MSGIRLFLTEEKLTKFARSYSYTNQPKKVALVMAGNIPFVGFHDLLCVLLSGNHAIIKLSSSDSKIPLEIINWLYQWEPRMVDRIHIANGPMKQFDAVIATGSNNSMGYFESYFGTFPHIFRKNRTSVAVLDGTETMDELKLLSYDCFDFFGMGCRSVTKLFLPEEFSTDRIFEGFVEQKGLINHHKYGNNYDYNRTVYLMNKIPFLDNNCCLLKEDSGLHAPLSVVFYERYSDFDELKNRLTEMENELQVIVGHQFTPFGKSQSPDLEDFADHIDTMKWLNEL